MCCVVHAAAVSGSGVGVLGAGTRLSGSCGGARGAHGGSLGDCLCARKENDICGSDPGNELVKLAEQEGIEAEGLNKAQLRQLLAAHFGLK